MSVGYGYYGDGYRSGEEDYASASSASSSPLPPWILVLLLSLAASLALYAQVLVTDHRFLPSLNVLCHALSVSPDVAAATVMSAGAASPNLNAVLISLFVTHSNLGVGTIVGSEMFQGLFCVAGAVLNARGGRGVVLDPVTCVREVGFYGLSLGLLVWMTVGRGSGTQQGGEEEEDDDEIVITTLDSALLLLVYAVYVVVCAYFDRIVAFYGEFARKVRKKVGKGEEDDASAALGSSSAYQEMGDLSKPSPPRRLSGYATAPPPSLLIGEEEDAPFLRLMSREPRQNFHRGDTYDGHEEDAAGDGDGGRRDGSGGAGADDRRFDGVLVDDNGERVVIGSFDPADDASIGAERDHATNDAAEEEEDAAETAEREKDSNMKKKKKKRGPLKKTLSFLVCKAPGPGGDTASGTPQRPSQLHELEDMELSASRDGDEESLSCFLWQRSIFYDRARIGRNAWQLRWFTFFADGRVESVPDRPQPTMGLEEDGATMIPGRLVYPPFGRVERDSAHLVVRLHSAADDDLAYVFMAPSEAVLREVLKRVRAALPPSPAHGAPPGDLLEAGEGGKGQEGRGAAPVGPLGKSPFSFEADAIEAEREYAPSLIDPPPPGTSFLHRAIHCAFLLPVRAAIHWTVPDVRAAARKKAEAHRPHATEPIKAATLSILACVVWLAINSYAMVASLERVGAILGIPDSIIGITVSAIGTSVSVYVASVAAARQGLGNMAISNAFASNTFNILVGLGLPWTLYCSFASEDGTYRGMNRSSEDDGDEEEEDDGIEESILILAVSLGATVVMIATGEGFALRRWHAWVLGGGYVAYLAYAVGRVVWVQ